MRLLKYRAPIVFCLIVLTGLSLTSVAMAGDSGRRYDSNNGFQGTYRVTESGTDRLYDANGNYEGKIIPNPDGDRFERYDSLGNYVGSIEEDESQE